ncbi:hypothetical protein MSPP1_003314 [Malassezia sp. CBS 17886]|nr:hypothetical protein MSPP1_003314 [Malassezia sp. CBS 17886]
MADRVLERQRLDDAILHVQRELARAPVMDATPGDVLERELHDSIAQHRALFLDLQEECDMEARAAERAHQIAQDLEGLAETPLPAADTRDARGSPAPTATGAADPAVEQALLQALLRTTQRAFPDKARCVALRALLEALLNATWETPSNPYVDVDGVDKTVDEFVRRAHLVEAHPQDARLLRLVPFHEALPDASNVKTTQYGGDE